MIGIDVLFKSATMGICFGLGLGAISWLLNLVLGFVKSWFIKLI